MSAENRKGFLSAYRCVVLLAHLTPAAHEIDSKADCEPIEIQHKRQARWHGMAWRGTYKLRLLSLVVELSLIVPRYEVDHGQRFALEREWDIAECNQFRYSICDREGKERVAAPWKPTEPLCFRFAAAAS